MRNGAVIFVCAAASLMLAVAPLSAQSGARDGSGGRPSVAGLVAASPPGYTAAPSTATPLPVAPAIQRSSGISAAPAGPYENIPISRDGAGRTPDAGGHEARAAGGGTAASNGASQPANQLDLKQMGMALGVVIALIFALRWLGRKFFAGTGPIKPSRTIRVVARSTLSPKQQLMLVSLGRRLVLVSNTSAGMSPLCEVHDADEVAEILGQIQREKDGSVAGSFKSLFSRAGKNFEAADDVDADADQAQPAKRPASRPAPAPARSSRSGMKGREDRAMLATDGARLDTDKLRRDGPPSRDIVDLQQSGDRQAPSAQQLRGDTSGEDYDNSDAEALDEDAETSQTHDELTGLMERVKALSRNFQRS